GGVRLKEEKKDGVARSAKFEVSKDKKKKGEKRDSRKLIGHTRVVFIYMAAKRLTEG
ncbi:hypothetical protein Bpfe_030523, partial [Biomphalaria pfeifferi]